MTLIAMIKVSDIRSPHLVEHAIKSVPANGSPSRRNGETFTCRTWVKDALVALHDNGAIVLPTDIETMEKKSIQYGMRYCRTSESGGGATVPNDAF
ncbi:hypothetical protein FCULG_00011909 [Fusarium culmorum]|uniref:Uncharacterized protein n=1 Tax=Fusarium culmorum TaxID=5516 RepID=A0A2T4GFM2_FUSCU|nr:hypothetical protein FCULG_00011909 [Fusarium culmorum]